MSTILFLTLTYLTSVSAAPIINKEGSTSPYGLCKQIDQQMMKESHWCRYGPINIRPAHKDLKIGRQTVYSGPLFVHKGWCGKMLTGSNASAGVAISTKYIHRFKHISPNSQYCGQCMCIRVRAPDTTKNPYPPRDGMKYINTIIKAQVQDQCPECEDDHIDILADRPYTFAPEDSNNPKARQANSHPGPRAIPRGIVYGVGVWTSEWNFVDCKTDCKQWFNKYPITPQIKAFISNYDESNYEDVVCNMVGTGK